MEAGTLHRCLSVLAAVTVASAIAFFVPYMAGASTFEGSAGYLSALLFLPALVVVALAMRAWGKRLVPNTSTYRATLVTYGVLSIPAVFVIGTLLF
ncbi:hypothetical protein [Luteimonas fraxinea]|uniref:hypothetical protein n=1 Tax=Luteimonas fraxinea TaxID=2901869 RepID=UPI001E520FD9|nr:hypothetical protein [Luteimonas fraxinea]MCD9124935.1 hypothetical protein [Luteimonas fraxinea]